MLRALRRYLASDLAEILNVIEGREAITAGDHHAMDEAIGEIEEIGRGTVV